MDWKAPLRRLEMRVNAMIARCVINVVNDSLRTQRVQLTILADEVADDVEHMQPYGVSFVPPAGAEALALGVKGMRSHTVAICANAIGERPTGNPPRTGGLYTDGDWRLFVDADGVVHVGAQRGDQFIALAQRVLDELNAVKADLDAVKSTFDAHTHLHSPGPSAPAPTAPPVAPIPPAHTPQSVAATRARAT